MGRRKNEISSGYLVTEREAYKQQQEVAGLRKRIEELEKLKLAYYAEAQEGWSKFRELERKFADQKAVAEAAVAMTSEARRELVEARTAAFEEAKRRAVEIIEEKLITMSVEFCMGNHIEVALPDDCIKAIKELKP